MKILPVMGSFRNPAIAKFFLDYLGLRKRFKVISLKKIRDRDFSIIDLCILMISLPILGIERTSLLMMPSSEETVVAKILGLKRIFDQSTLHRFLNLFQGCLSISWKRFTMVS